ncbi:MAG TPA: DUF3011 domain-containing protein [Vicinamibacterales bacterium]|nr:DUF3011 domain-containing protein [Vicinamibacterales bacterium]
MVIISKHLATLERVLCIAAGIAFLSVSVCITEASAQAVSKAFIDCGDGGPARQVCEGNTLSGVVLVRQGGEGNCVLGRTWGYDSKAVWVSNGCRARFATTDTRETMTCASEGARHLCDATTTEGVVVVNRPDVEDPLLDPDYGVRYAIAGAEIGLGANMYAYLESRVFDDSIGPQGEDGFNAVTIGVHYGFSFSGWHRR